MQYSTTLSPPTEAAVHFPSSTLNYVPTARRCVPLPRCFRGPIIIRTRDDGIALSPALTERTALISDVSGVWVYFIGDRPRGGEWGNGANSNNGKTVQ